MSEVPERGKGMLKKRRDFVDGWRPESAAAQSHRIGVNESTMYWVGLRAPTLIWLAHTSVWTIKREPQSPKNG